MRYVFAGLLVLLGHAVQAQIGLLQTGGRAAVSAHSLAKRPTKAGAKAKEAAAPPVKYVTPFTYRGQTVSHQRTAADQLKGKGSTEILALEALLEETYTAMRADSAQSFCPPARFDAIAAAARTAAGARPSWDYYAYQNELAFYQQEEARRQRLLNPPPPPARRPPVKRRG
ncbi:hypothetical protein [Hymenobacter edaphi]|uniref:Uncharacterized protein n=1 Tax=Hymenobacter edaphi TaxID=2211146 RepID=A0A328BTE4_9BACT|nr:hypothetical protein [Hymenobacter edaphi]RAK70570.1 hypothetical protein DLM85_06980 [Hymenobacter edaphi]